uniref:Uncharacterized protein n=1 Tax=Oryza brachyantha TaxID=4533 RepID=J3M948_ORYBR
YFAWLHSLLRRLWLLGSSGGACAYACLYAVMISSSFSFFGRKELAFDRKVQGRCDSRSSVRICAAVQCEIWPG